MIAEGVEETKQDVLKLAMWLKEMSYFSQVSFVFLIIGHIKNACNCLFISLKHEYHTRKIFMTDELIVALNVSKSITIIPTVTTDFLNYDGASRELIHRRERFDKK